MSETKGRSPWGLAVALIGVGVVGAFVLWAETDPPSLHAYSVEDGLFESLTALLFGISGVGFLIAMKRSRFLRERSGRWQYALILAWTLLMFVFAGEEISWGQRILNFGTPESMKVVNKQEEFNIHNIKSVDSFLGGAYRYLTIMMLTTGLLLPITASTNRGRRLVQKFAVPVLQNRYMGLFVGSYLFGKYYDPMLDNTAAEIRELLMGIGMALFGLHGALRPESLFRVDQPGSGEGMASIEQVEPARASR
jgi:hypothetical protein